MDARFAQSLISTQFPDLKTPTVTYLGEGLDSTAFEVNGELVFRFPKRQEVDDQLLIEARMLDALSPGAPLSIPLFTCRGTPSAAYPFHFAGYRKLPGIEAIRIDPDELSFTALAAPLGRFLGWLHSFPVSDALARGIKARDGAGDINGFHAEAVEAVDRASGVVPAEEVQRWRTFLSSVPLDVRPPRTPVVLHSDFYQEHLLLDPSTRTITGIIDWGDVELGDPAIDLAGVFAWGGAPFARDVLKHYSAPKDDGLLERARWLAGLRSAVDVKYGIELRQPEFLAAGRRGLTLAGSG